MVNKFHNFRDFRKECPKILDLKVFHISHFSIIHYLQQKRTPTVLTRISKNTRIRVSQKFTHFKRVGKRKKLANLITQSHISPVDKRAVILFPFSSFPFRLILLRRFFIENRISSIISFFLHSPPTFKVNIVSYIVNIYLYTHSHLIHFPSK